MRVFVTGATGFIGSGVARALRERGDEVRALVRSPERATGLRGLGCELVTGDLHDVTAATVDGCDAVVHGAAVYRVGVTRAQAESMRETNVGGTEQVLDAAAAAGTGRIVYVSTVNCFGDTHGSVVDEGHVRPTGSFLSAYDETKWEAHQAAHRRAAPGAPVVVAMPGLVYGPGDSSQMGDQIRLAMAGKLPYVSFPGLGVNAVYVEDVVAGILLVLGGGRVGEDYVLGGELTRARELLATAARAAGRRPPRLTMPTWAIALTGPLGRTGLGPRLGIPPNVRELIAATDGVTYWASDTKARAELGYAPRGLQAGMEETFRLGA